MKTTRKGKAAKIHTVTAKPTAPPELYTRQRNIKAAAEYIAGHWNTEFKDLSVQDKIFLCNFTTVKEAKKFKFNINDATKESFKFEFMGDWLRVCHALSGNHEKLVKFEGALHIATGSIPPELNEACQKEFELLSSVCKNSVDNIDPKQHISAPQDPFVGSATLNCHFANYETGQLVDISPRTQEMHAQRSHDTGLYAQTNGLPFNVVDYDDERPPKRHKGISHSENAQSPDDVISKLVSLPAATSRRLAILGCDLPKGIETSYFARHEQQTELRSVINGAMYAITYGVRLYLPRTLDEDMILEIIISENCGKMVMEAMSSLDPNALGRILGGCLQSAMEESARGFSNAFQIESFGKDYKARLWLSSTRQDDFLFLFV